MTAFLHAYAAAWLVSMISLSLLALYLVYRLAVVGLGMVVR